MPERSIAPEFNKVNHIGFSRATKVDLDNGIPLFVINAGTQPVIRLEFIIPAGSIVEPHPGLSYFSSKMLQEGTNRKSSKEISRLLDKFGAFLEISPGFDFVTITVYTLNKHLTSILPTIQELLFEPSFPEDELEILKTIKIQNTKVNQEKTSYLASINFRKNIFGNEHPYGKELLEEEIIPIKPERLKAFYQNYYFNSWDIILSGFITENEISEINKFFGKHKSHARHSTSPLAPSPKSKKEIVNKEGSLQSSIRIGKIMVTKSNNDFPKLKVVNEILGGYFGSRLMKNIREDKGFTYGIHSNLVVLKQEGYFVIGTDVKREFTAQTLEEIYKEIIKLQQEPIHALELETVRNYMAGSFLSEINTPFALADKFKGVYLNGLDYNYYEELIDTINSITAEEVLEISQKYLQIDTMTEVIAGGI